jgi:hypothetical protein
MKFSGDIQVTRITPQVVNDWSNSLSRYQNPVSGKPLKANTINGYRRGVRAFFNHLERLGYLRESPTANFFIPWTIKTKTETPK